MHEAQPITSAYVANVIRSATSDEIAVTTTTKKIIKMRLRGDAQIIYRYRLLEKI